MYSANLLPPSAPPAETLYPVVATEPSQNFRLQKVNEISNTLAGEVHHYRLVAKNTNARESSLIGAPPALAFSRQRFPARVLAPLCLWLACRLPFLLAALVGASLSFRLR